MSHSLKLVVIGGLPGTGKTELAEALSQKARIPTFSRDQIEAAIVRSSLEFPSKHSSRPDLEGVGYDVLLNLAMNLLRLGHSAIIDFVCPKRSLLQTWKTLAQEYRADWRPIQCICSDTKIHRGRIQSRQRSIVGWYEVHWSDVQRLSALFEPWSEEHLVIDTVKPMAENLDVAASYVLGESASNSIAPFH